MMAINHAISKSSEWEQIHRRYLNSWMCSLESNIAPSFNHLVRSCWHGLVVHFFDHLSFVNLREIREIVKLH